MIPQHVGGQLYPLTNGKIQLDLYSIVINLFSKFEEIPSFHSGEIVWKVYYPYLQSIKGHNSGTDNLIELKLDLYFIVVNLCSKFTENS